MLDSTLGASGAGFDWTGLLYTVGKAIIYFIIAWVLTRALTAIQKRIDPRNRRKRIKF